MNVSDVMTTDVKVITPTTSLGEAARLMRDNDIGSLPVHRDYEDQSIDEVAENMAQLQVRRLPVVSREKKLVGFVSLSNIASARDEAATKDLLDGTAQPH